MARRVVGCPSAQAAQGYPFIVEAVLRSSRLAAARVTLVRCLVTGGAGFIGHHLVRRLLDDGFEVRVMDNFATGRRDRLSGFDVELVEGDLRSSERVHTAVRDVEVVYHLGALPSVQRSLQDPLATHAVNVDGTLNVLLAARDSGVRRVLFASSSSIYGANPALPKSEGDLPLPLSPYAVSKLSGERYCAAITAVYGIETVALRLFNVFGPGQSPDSEYAAVVPKFVTAMTRGEAPVIFGDGLQTRDFTYVADVVDAFRLGADAPKGSGLAFNVACGVQTSLLDLVRNLNEILSTDIEARHGPAREGEVRFSEGDAALARDVLGWSPDWTVTDGLRACVGVMAQAS